MKEWIQKQIENDFADFRGLTVSAQIPIKDRLVNELLTQALKGGSETNGPPGDTADFRRLLKYVEKAELHASEGVIAVDVVIKV